MDVVYVMDIVDVCIYVVVVVVVVVDVDVDVDVDVEVVFSGFKVVDVDEMVVLV